MFRKIRPSRGWIVALGLCALAPLGCQSSRQSLAHDAMTAPPTLEELPNLKDPYERKIAAKIDYEGSGTVSHIKLVPDFKPVEPTPEEKAILGEKPKSALDELLAFYRPQRGPEHGVSPLDGSPRIGTSLTPSTSIGRSNIAGGIEVLVYGHAGMETGARDVKRSIATVYNEGGIKIGRGFEHQVRVGYGPKRTAAARSPRLD